MTETIFDILLRFLYTEHVDYAIDLSLAGLFSGLIYLFFLKNLKDFLLLVS